MAWSLHRVGRSSSFSCRSRVCKGRRRRRRRRRPVCFVVEVPAHGSAGALSPLPSKAVHALDAIQFGSSEVLVAARVSAGAAASPKIEAHPAARHRWRRGTRRTGKVSVLKDTCCAVITRPALAPGVALLAAVRAASPYLGAALPRRSRVPKAALASTLALSALPVKAAVPAHSRCGWAGALVGSSFCRVGLKLA